MSGAIRSKAGLYR